MSIVGRGLPDGPIVTGGLGFNEPATPGAMSALIVGTGSVTATASLTTDAIPMFFGGGGARRPEVAAPPRRRPKSVSLAALLVGSGRVTTATAVTTKRQITGFDDLEVLLTLELV